MTYLRTFHRIAAAVAWLVWVWCLYVYMGRGGNPAAAKGDLPVEFLAVAALLSATLRLWPNEPR